MSINKEYLEHSVFNDLNKYSNFYNDLGVFTMGFISQGTQSIINLDTYVYSSIKGTIESIKDILLKGRINDSYTLLRKYYDSTIINVYTNLFLILNYNEDNLIVQQIENWRKGSERIPDFRKMTNYIKNSEKLGALFKLIHKDNRYKLLRDRCNDHTHYNYYRNVLLNDNNIYLFDKRITALNDISNDLTDIFIQHFALIFSLNEHYMASTDYLDCLESGLTPQEGSEYFVAPYIQKLFDTVVTLNRPDIAKQLKINVSMNL